MKQTLHLCFALCAILFASCGYDDSDILSRLDALEDENKSRIATLQQQIDAINSTLPELQQMDEELRDYITTLQDVAKILEQQIGYTNSDVSNLSNKLDSTIATLQEADDELSEGIEALEAYVNGKLQNNKDWASATFATLEQYNALVANIALIKESIQELNNDVEALEQRMGEKIAEEIATAVEGLNGTISTSIADLESSMKAWVNEQLTGYYTIAEVDAMLEALQKSVDENNESLQKDIEELSTKVDNMKTELTEAYAKAIEEAINTNNGVIDGKIAEKIAAVNGRIDSEVAAINARISALEERVDDLEQDVEYLLSRIQSISYIPKYSDGRATLRYFQDTGYLNLDFEISPKEILPTLMEVWESTVTIKAVVTETRAVDFITLPIKSFETNLTNGVISLSITGDSLIPLCLAENKSASIAMSISDGNNSVVSEYIPIVLKVAEHIDMWDYFYIYSHWDDTKYVVAYYGGIRFDWYLKKLGGKKSDPVAAGTYVVSDWESTTTKDYIDSSATKINGVLLQNGGVVTITEVAEGYEFTFDVTDKNGTNWKGTYTGPIDPNLYFNPYAN